MTIEATLERIAVALENIHHAVHAVGGTVPKAVEEAKPPKESKPKKAAPVTETATAPAAEKAAAPAVSAESEEKAFTLDDVRAKLVAVQTKFKTPEAARDLIAKHSKDGVKTLSGLGDDQARFAALIAEATKLLAE